MNVGILKKLIFSICALLLNFDQLEQALDYICLGVDVYIIESRSGWKSRHCLYL